MENNLKKFEEIKQNAEKEYKLIESVLCPFLNRKISFNAKGLDHIKFKEWNKTRPVSDQYLRLKFLKFAPRVLKKTTTLQEYNEKNNFERIARNSRWTQVMTPVKYYGFIAIIDYKIRIRIVVKEIEGGQPFFWSIMPYWRTKNNPITEETKKVFHEGDLEKE